MDYNKVATEMWIFIISHENMMKKILPTFLNKKPLILLQTQYAYLQMCLCVQIIGH